MVVVVMVMVVVVVYRSESTISGFVTGELLIEPPTVSLCSVMRAAVLVSRASSIIRW
jgi:hypothetical protein